jgi:hypothetical protein
MNDKNAWKKLIIQINVSSIKTVEEKREKKRKDKLVKSVSSMGKRTCKRN